MAKRNPKLPFTDEQLKELFDQGLNNREISEHLGVARSTVGVHRRRLRPKTIRTHKL